MSINVDTTSIDRPYEEKVIGKRDSASSQFVKIVQKAFTED
jgi:hypothetical protein